MHDFYTPPPKTVSTEFMAFGNCLGMDPEDFFPDRGNYHKMRAAKAVCQGCEVRLDCLEYALDTPIEKFGIWGGTSEKERRTMRVARAMAKRQIA